MKQLKKSDFANMPEMQRLNALNESGKILPGYSYSKPLTEEDIKKKNIELNQAIQRIGQLEEERKDIGSLIKDQKEIVNKNNKEVIDKFISVSEKCWEIIDTEMNVVEIINSDGHIIESSRIKGGEQLNMFRQTKDAV